MREWSGTFFFLIAESAAERPCMSLATLHWSMKNELIRWVFPNVCDVVWGVWWRSWGVCGDEMEICVSCIPHVLFVSFPIVLHCFLLFSICRRCPSFPLELFLCFPFFFVFPLFAFLPFPLVSCCFRSFPAHFLFLPFVSHRFIPFPIVSYCFPPFPSVSLFPIVTRFFSLLVSFRSLLFPMVS